MLISGATSSSMCSEAAWRKHKRRLTEAVGRNQKACTKDVLDTQVSGCKVLGPTVISLTLLDNGDFLRPRSSTLSLVRRVHDFWRGAPRPHCLGGGKGCMCEV